MSEVVCPVYRLHGLSLRGNTYHVPESSQRGARSNNQLAAAESPVTLGSRKSMSVRLDLLNRRDWQTSPLLDESSHSLTSDVGSRDVGWMRDRLEQANAEDLDSSCTDSPKPASERTSFDYVSEVGEVWQRHRFSCISRS